MTRPNAERGFTLVELLISSVVALIGLYASLNMAMLALHANEERRDSIGAEQLAEHILSTMQAEAVFWTTDTPPQVEYLYHLPAYSPGATTGWLPIPGTEQATDKRVGRMGADTVFDSGIRFEVQTERGTQYCGFWRLTWVTDALVRAETKIAWQRAQVDADKYRTCPITMTDDLGNVGSITLPAMVMKNVYVQ